MSIIDPPTNRLEETILNCLIFYTFDDKNEGWMPDYALDEMEED